MRFARLWITASILFSQCFSYSVAQAQNDSGTQTPQYEQGEFAHPGRRMRAQEEVYSENSAQEAKRPRRSRASAALAIPYGLVAVIPPKEHKEQSNVEVASNPYISGIAVQMNWRDLESTEGQIDWSKLDSIFSAAQTSQKWIHLLIFPGFFAPDWAKAGAQSDSFPIQYGPGHGTVETLPMPWDRVYLHRWFAFLKQVSDRYGNSPAFRMIAANGPASVSAEMTLPNNPQDHKKWLNDGYAVGKYLEAWNQVFQFYANTFPNQCISLSAPGLPVLGPGKHNPNERKQDRVAIVNQATNILGSRLAIQWSDLHAGHARAEAPDETGFVIDHSGRIITGLQMRCSAQGDSEVMGAAGDPPLALRRSIDKGMQPNSSGQHVNYLEIYERDILAQDTQPVLRYGASLFGPNQPPARLAGTGRAGWEDSGSSQNQDVPLTAPPFRRRPNLNNQ